MQRLQEIEQARTKTQEAVIAAWSRLVAANAAIESDQTAVNDAVKSAASRFQIVRRSTRSIFPICAIFDCPTSQ